MIFSKEKCLPQIKICGLHLCCPLFIQNSLVSAPYKKKQNKNKPELQRVAVFGKTLLYSRASWQNYSSSYSLCDLPRCQNIKHLAEVCTSGASEELWSASWCELCCSHLSNQITPKGVQFNWTEKSSSLKYLSWGGTMHTLQLEAVSALQICQ